MSADQQSLPLVSVIVPSRNEAEDIGATLDAILTIDYPRKEVIVVDDSSDETPAIIASYADRGVCLIHREYNRNGCCGARNRGMQEASGEIIVLMNADNRPQPDFLDRLLPHYWDGADYVIVRSTILNTDSLWGKFAYASGKLAHERTDDPQWSEGFSCRSSAARAVGYIPGDFPVPFCRDHMLGRALDQAGFRKHLALDIPMGHVVPDSLVSYWRNQVWRGSFSAPFAYYFRNMPLALVWAREMFKALRRALKYFLVFPAIRETVNLARCTSSGWQEACGLFFVGLVQDAAIGLGNLKGLMRVMRLRQCAERIAR